MGSKIINIKEYKKKRQTCRFFYAFYFSNCRKAALIKSTILKVSENGFFTINTLNNTKENKYVSKVLLNGKELENKQISYFSIQAGNELTIYMAAKP